MADDVVTHYLDALEVLPHLFGSFFKLSRVKLLSRGHHFAAAQPGLALLPVAYFGECVSGARRGGAVCDCDRVGCER